MDIAVKFGLLVFLVAYTAIIQFVYYRNNHALNELMEVIFKDYRPGLEGTSLMAALVQQYKTIRSDNEILFYGLLLGYLCIVVSILIIVRSFNDKKLA